jgi:hypothetical protein
MKQAELMAALSRKDRDIQSIMAQKRDALAALENVPAGERSLGGGAATLAVLERLKDLQDKVEPPSRGKVAFLGINQSRRSISNLLLSQP